MPPSKRTSEASREIARAAVGLALETATYATCAAAMDSRHLPTREMVINAEGQPVWRVCGMGICIETGSGVRAQAEFEALCVSMGLESSGEPPRRGPSEADEPGV